MNSIRARELFDAYDGSDLMPLPDPMADESLATYLQWNPEANKDFDDTLFLYLLRDLANCDRAEGCDRLRVAIGDLRSVLNAIEHGH